MKLAVKPLQTQIVSLINEISKLNAELHKQEKLQSNFIKLNMLITKRLSIPLDVVIEPDDDGFIARTIDMPLYGFGDDIIESINALKYEIESLYNDLMEDDNFSDEWLQIKKFLKESIID